MLTWPRITAALAVAALIALLAAAPANASTTRATSSAQPAAAAVPPSACATEVQGCLLIDPYYDIEARYNSTAGYWRAADTVNTPVWVIPYGSDDYVIEDTNTGDFMDYESGYIEETDNFTLARAHWYIASCGNGTYTIANVYEDDQGNAPDLAGETVGDPLYTASTGCDANDSWEIETYIVVGPNQ
jgi:hypothetical protein